MKKILISFLFFISTLPLFAISIDECKDIIIKELEKFESIYDTQIDVENFELDDKNHDQYILLSFDIKGRSLSIISKNDKDDFRKKTQLLFDSVIVELIEYDEDRIYTIYKNTISAKGDFSMRDIVYAKGKNGKLSSFMVDKIIKENNEKISLLKPLKNAELFVGAKLTKKENPVFLDFSYTLGFVNEFRHVLEIDAKVPIFYPLFASIGLRDDFVMDFSFSPVENYTGLNISLECLLPLDIFSKKKSSLNIYGKFNTFFALENGTSKLFYESDLQIGLKLFRTTNTALDFAFRIFSLFVHEQSEYFDFPMFGAKFGLSFIL